MLAAIADLRAAGASPTAINTKLRSQFDDRDLIAAALTQSELRAKAVSKFGELSASMLFTQAGLEQASRLRVAELHAARFDAAGCTSVTDLGSGLGAESLAFLRAGLRVTAVEIDPLTARFARHNLAVQHEQLTQPASTSAQPRPPEVVVADATALELGATDAVFLDPARRTSGHRDTRRLTSADDYSPSLDFAFDAVRGARAGGIKLGPGFDRALIPADAEAQWVSVDGSVVEMGLWFGAAARPGIRRSATVVRGTDGLVSELTAASDADDVPVRSLGKYLYEPDGTVIRARLIGQLAQELGAGMIDEHIAYLTADHLVATEFAQAFRIVDELPSREKELKRALRDRSIGSLEIKKRGVDVDPAALRTRLRLAGPNSATLILTRTERGHLALLAERC